MSESKDATDLDRMCVWEGGEGGREGERLHKFGNIYFSNKNEELRCQHAQNKSTFFATCGVLGLISYLQNE